jgi:methanogenic corrinoid protein MtbC1
MDRSPDAPSGDDAPSCPPATRPDPRFSAPPPWLQRFVEHELVPHLLDPTRSPARRPAPADALRSADVEALVELLLADDSPGCDAWIDALRGAGIDADRLCDELIAPAARRLGERWDQDRCDFARVSIALGRLQALVHRAGTDPARAGPAPQTGRVLVATLADRDHLLGAVIVADAFRRAGWDVAFDPGAGEAELLRRVRSVRFDLIGVSVALERDAARLRALLGALRAASRNPSVTTMAGGPALHRRPALRDEIGVDLVAADAREAVRLAGRALSPRPAAGPAAAAATTATATATATAGPASGAAARLRRPGSAATPRAG